MGFFSVPQTSQVGLACFLLPRGLQLTGVACIGQTFRGWCTFWESGVDNEEPGGSWLGVLVENQHPLFMDCKVNFKGFLAWGDGGDGAIQIFSDPLMGSVLILYGSR